MFCLRKKKAKFITDDIEISSYDEENSNEEN